MLAKLVQADMDARLIDDAAKAVEQELIPSFVAYPGARHGYWMANRQSGQVLALTCWSDGDSLEAARAEDGRERARVAERIGLRVRAIQTLDVLGFQEDPAIEGPVLRFARATWVEGLGSHNGSSLRAMYREIAPRQASSPGFCASYWLGDYGTGNGLGLSFWSGSADLRGDDFDSKRRRALIEQTVGCKINLVSEYEALGVAVPSRIDGINLTEASVPRETSNKA